MDPTLEWMLGCLAWHTGSWCSLMYLSRTILKHWLRGGKWNGEEKMEMDRKRKEEAYTHTPPKLDKCCHLSQCAHTHLYRSPFQPMQRDLTGCIILSQDIFLCLSMFTSKQKKRNRILGLSAGTLRCGGIQSAKALSNFPNSYWFSKPELRDFPASLASSIKGLIIFRDQTFLQLVNGKM